MITYLSWWYAQEFSLLWRAVKVITYKTFHSFSVGLLLRTLFDPWKRDVSSAENASLGSLYQIWLANLISRLVGFVMRSLTIFAGLLMTILVFIILFLLLLFWLFLPIIIVYLLASGINIILNG